MTSVATAMKFETKLAIVWLV